MEATALISRNDLPPGAVLLAAGSASRMGRPKQLLRWNGKTLLEIALDNALNAGFSPIVVVGGAYWEAIEDLCAPLRPRVEICHHKDWALGMGGSIACGMRELVEMEPALPGALIFLADQPAVNENHFKVMHQTWAENHPSYVAAYYRGKAGAPAIFSRALFPELLALRGEQGAKGLFQHHSGVLYPLPEAALDIDTPEDWKNFTEEK